MASVDYKSELVTALWAALEASGTAFSNLVKPGSRLKPTIGGAAANRAQKAPADYPQVKIELGNGDNQDTPHLTFARTISPSAVIPVRQQLIITITHQTEDQSKQSPVEASVYSGIYSLYASGALAYLCGLKIGESRKKGEGRTVVTLSANLSLRMRFSQITG